MMFHRHIGRVPALFLTLALLFASGCATIDRQSAVRLATQGTAVAQGIQGSVSETQNALESYVEGQYLMSPLTGRPEPTAAMLEDVQRVRRALSLRASMMGELANTYSAFSALASYDAAGEVESAVGGLTGAINSYASVVSPGSAPISALTGTIVAKGAGQIASYAQAKRIKAASATLRILLGKMAGLLEKEKTLHTGIREAIVLGTGQSAKAIWRWVLAILAQSSRSNSTCLASAITRSSLDRRLAALAENDPQKFGQFNEAIIKVVNYRIETQIDLQMSIVAQSIQGLTVLISQHEQLERGQDLDLATATMHVAMLRSFVDELRTLNVSDSASMNGQ